MNHVKIMYLKGRKEMKKEDFIALGINEELATKAAESSKNELEAYIPKSRFHEVNEAKKQLETDLKIRDSQLEELKKNSGDNAELKAQLETLQAENKAAKQKYEQDMKNLKLDTAIQLAIGETAQDMDLVAGLVDKSKLILSEDGKVTGIEEQLKALKETKSFLFKQETKQPQIKGSTPISGTGTPATKKPSEMTYSELCAYLEANPEASIE